MMHDGGHRPPLQFRRVLTQPLKPRPSEAPSCGGDFRHQELIAFFLQFSPLMLREFVFAALVALRRRRRPDVSTRPPLNFLTGLKPLLFSSTHRTSSARRVSDLRIVASSRCAIQLHSLTKKRAWIKRSRPLSAQAIAGSRAAFSGHYMEIFRVTVAVWVLPPPVPVTLKL